MIQKKYMGMVVFVVLCCLFAGGVDVYPQEMDAIEDELIKSMGYPSRWKPHLGVAIHWEPGTEAARFVAVDDTKTFTLYFNKNMPTTGYDILVVTDNCVDPVSGSRD